MAVPQDRLAEIGRLRAQRPRRPFVRRSLWVLAAIILGSWLAGDFAPEVLSSARGQANAARFWGELQPWPLQQTDAPTGWVPRLAAAARWWGQMWQAKGAAAVATTLAISLMAIFLAGLIGGLASLPAARNFATPRPFLALARPAARRTRWAWRGVVAFTRAVLTVLRALPEYVWAFLLLALLGPTPWPLILALALHNAGILGKLTAEVIENADTRAPGALRAAGAGRLGIAVAALLPLTLPRFLLFFFYRWETCVREATVLGMLGISSLGFWIVDSRARGTYDEMVFYISCGALMVLLGDLVSGLVRSLLRRA